MGSTTDPLSPDNAAAVVTHTHDKKTIASVEQEVGIRLADESERWMILKRSQRRNG